MCTKLLVHQILTYKNVGKDVKLEAVIELMEKLKTIKKEVV